MEQEALYMQGRILPGKIVTNAQGGCSAHNYGCATDFTLWGGTNPIWMTESDKRWNVYRDACEKLGLTWGGNWGDSFHNELSIREPWSKVKASYMIGGMDEAQSFIRSQLEPR